MNKKKRRVCIWTSTKRRKKNKRLVSEPEQQQTVQHEEGKQQTRNEDKKQTGTDDKRLETFLMETTTNFLTEWLGPEHLADFNLKEMVAAATPFFKTAISDQRTSFTLGTG